VDWRTVGYVRSALWEDDTIRERPLDMRPNSPPPELVGVGTRQFVGTTGTCTTGRGLEGGVLLLWVGGGGDVPEVHEYDGGAVGSNSAS
jgi:hypothetical protein